MLSVARIFERTNGLEPNGEKCEKMLSEIECKVTTFRNPADCF